jgi:hypothetical protein
MYSSLFLKCKTIPVTDSGGLQGYDMSRIPYFIDNWYTNNNEIKVIWGVGYSVYATIAG